MSIRDASVCMYAARLRLQYTMAGKVEELETEEVEGRIFERQRVYCTASQTLASLQIR